MYDSNNYTINDVNNNINNYNYNYYTASSDYYSHACFTGTLSIASDLCYRDAAMIRFNRKAFEVNFDRIHS